MNSEPVLALQVSELNFDQLGDQIYLRVRDEILKGNLRPGQRLSINALSDLFGVSATPVRDALRQLSADGLVEMKPRRGTHVREFDPRNIQEIFEIRRIVECAAVDKLAQSSTAIESKVAKMEEVMDEVRSLQVENKSLDYISFSDLDAAFHQCIVDLLNNEQMSRLYRDLRWSVQIVRCLYASSQQRTDETLREHDRILGAFRARDTSSAKEAILEHLANAEANLLRNMPQERTNHQQ